MTLLPRDTYRRISGDTTSLDSDVDQALVDAQQLLEEALRRGYHDATGAWVGCLEQATRTETVHIHGDGRAYPLATPIISVSVPSQAVVRDNAVLGLVPIADPLWDILYEPYHSQGADITQPLSSITYVGGSTLTTLPRKLRQALADLTRLELTTFDPASAGIKSANVVGVSVVYADAPDRASTLNTILAEVRGFRRRDIGY